MSEYNRFVSYMYVYENNIKASNNGFVRIEIKDNLSSIYIHMKEICQGRENDHNVYIVRRFQGILEGVFLGKLERENGHGEFCHKIDRNDIDGTGLELTEMAGIVVLSQNGKKYGTCWDDELLDFRTFKKYEKMSSGEITKSNDEETINIEVQSQSSEVVVPEPPYSKTKSLTIYERLDKILEQGEKMYPFEDDEIEYCVRLELQDIGMLPMKFWLYASNSFLLRSYYSYRHLILCKKKNGIYLLGVPGMAEKKDQFMAQTFGFNCFKPLRVMQDHQSDFGYWYVELSEK